jgi:hypothetical protein
MNKEDLKENYILLSKIAKEKKYAQEYLGLLARRGDIGSIRIGKRWYITREWFSEFLRDSQERKMKMEQNVVVEKTTIEKKPDREVSLAFSDDVPLFQRTKLAIDGSTGSVYGFNIVLNEAKADEKVVAAKQFPKEEVGSEKNEMIEISIPAKGRSTVQVRKENFAFRKRSEAFSRPETKRTVIDLRNLEEMRQKNQREEHIVEHRNMAMAKEDHRSGADALQAHEEADAYWDYKVRRKDTILSPVFSGQDGAGISWFPKLAFGFSFVLLFFLLFQGAFSYRKDIMDWAGLEKGTVAGISDERRSNPASLGSAAGYFINDQDSQMKESVSLSQLMLRAALEKEKNSESEEEK